MTASPDGAAYLVSGVSRSHRVGRRGTVLAVDDVDLVVGRGEVFGLLGPNGAGKSTFVRLLVGLLQPDAGAIRLLGHDVVAAPNVAARAVGYLAQVEAALDDMPVAVAVETTGRLRGLSPLNARTARTDVLDELGIAALAARPV